MNKMYSTSIVQHYSHGLLPLAEGGLIIRPTVRFPTISHDFHCRVSHGAPAQAPRPSLLLGALAEHSVAINRDLPPATAPSAAAAGLQELQCLGAGRKEHREKNAPQGAKRLPPPHTAPGRGRGGPSSSSSSSSSSTLRPRTNHNASKVGCGCGGCPKGAAGHRHHCCIDHPSGMCRLSSAVSQPQTRNCHG